MTSATISPSLSPFQQIQIPDFGLVPYTSNPSANVHLIPDVKIITWIQTAKGESDPSMLTFIAEINKRKISYEKVAMTPNDFPHIANLKCRISSMYCRLLENRNVYLFSHQGENPLTYIIACLYAKCLKTEAEPAIKFANAIFPKVVLTRQQINSIKNYCDNLSRELAKVEDFVVIDNYTSKEMIEDDFVIPNFDTIDDIPTPTHIAKEQTSKNPKLFSRAITPLTNIPETNVNEPPLSLPSVPAALPIKLEKQDPSHLITYKSSNVNESHLLSLLKSGQNPINLSATMPATTSNAAAATTLASESQSTHFDDQEKQLIVHMSLTPSSSVEKAMPTENNKIIVACPAATPISTSTRTNLRQRRVSHEKTEGTEMITYSCNKKNEPFVLPSTNLEESSDSDNESVSAGCFANFSKIFFASLLCTPKKKS